MKKGEVVTIGPSLVVILASRVAMIRGVGQVWRTTNNRFVMSMVDIHGHTNWSLVQNLYPLWTYYDALGLWESDFNKNLSKSGLYMKGQHIGEVIKMTLDEWPGEPE